jgi:DNA mismatch repair protein MutS2
MSSFQNAIDKLEFEKVRQRVLRYAVSEVGAEAIRMLPISTSLHDVRRELSLVSEMKRLLENESGLPLDGIFPIRDALQRSAVEGTVLLPKELAQVHSTLRSARTLRQFLSKREGVYPAIWSIADDIHVDKVLEFNLDRAIDEAGNVKANASRELQSLRRSIAEKYEQTRKKLESILKTVSELGFSQDEIITTRDGRMVIPVKAEHKNRVHGFIHSASASGATVFIEPSDTLDLNNEIRSLQFQEQREVERILRELTGQVRDIHEKLISNLHVLGYLDSIHARAKYSLETLSVEPEITDVGSIILKKARHPLLLQTHGHDGTIPLDIELGGDYNTIVISGPNAGGKSVAMKTVGLLALMAQSGMHIPAGEGSVLRLFEKIFVDIGDDQSIENDLSTFSSHLQNLKRIYDEADDRSLVLSDEIGSGTDPAEGGALAAALLE